MRPMDFEFGPDGALYLIEWGTGFGGNNDDSGVYRIDYIAGDRAPIAVAGGHADVRAGAADRAVLQRRLRATRTASRPHLRLGLRRRRHRRTEANPSHTYTAAGNYTAQLTVTDAERPHAAGQRADHGRATPRRRSPSTFPPDGGFFDWGDQVRYTVTVTDPEDGTIDCDRRRSCSTTSATTSTRTRCSSTPAAPARSCSPVTPGTAEANVFAVFEATYTDDGGTARPSR